MIEPTQQTLIDGSGALAGASARARGWIKRLAKTATSVGNEEHSLIEETLRSENQARKLAASSGRRNSAGVFGPSQAGKSYLVSVLGKSQGRPLIADFAGETKNFIKELNPEGGKESTGLVTRFTIVKGTRDSSHPVELRLLTETDLVKIIGNSFLSDFNQHSRRLGLASEDDIRAAIARLEAGARTGPEHLDEIQMFDIGEYFRDNFKTTIGPLSRAGYWDALTRFGHRLSTAQRAEMYSLLWGSCPELTDTFLLLLKSLDALGHPLTARAAIDCLVPRASSIIDVEVLKQYLGTAEDQADTIAVVAERADGADGAPVQVPRATLTALVAEIKVVMTERPWNFFEHTDLLDFPGARAREQMIDLPHEADERAVCVRNMLLRGKIAYLFQRYTEERELTCMLLCMPPSNQEVKDLTSLVGKWVAQTHGDTPQTRAALPCALFFVLTKFDMELQSKPGDTPESWTNRIDTRLEASMYQLYKQEEWLQNWNGKAFSNTYFLRNPDYELDAVFEYAAAEPGEGRKEAGIAAVAKERLDANRDGMVNSDRCKTHFTNPEQAWDEAMRLNDGGVGYLVENLERVLSPQLKTHQLGGRLLSQGQQLDARLRRFYQADDDSSRKEKEQALMNLRMRLFQVSKERQYRNFIQLLSRMKLAEADVRGAFLNVAALRIDTAAAADPAGASAAASPWDDDPWATTAGPAADAPVQVHVQRDRSDYFAAEVINLWTERVRMLSTDTATLASLGMDAQLVGDIGNELVIGAHRNQLAERIAGQIRSQVAAANVRWDEVADRCAGIAAMLVNDYVAHLGFAEQPAAQRPAFPGGARPRVRGVFESLPSSADRSALADQRTPLEHEYFLDWGVSLLQIGLDNVSFSGGREIDEADNRELGEILAGLSPALEIRVGAA